MNNVTPVDRMRELLEKQLLDVLENGQQQINQATGEMERVAPSAAFLRVAMQYIKDNGGADESREQQRAKTQEFVSKVIKLKHAGNTDARKLIEAIEDDGDYKAITA